ncbi:MAG: histidinol-phosphate aminotransferase family protein [Chloroflexi bacterium]|jgi:histidinol-phosphate aminotransferase|uniref:histidinol-phosphate transaminase n=1 Tax=Candidatus Thermofonsia Clade 3 bacterium TaxID=2364212 RepID=A0A2M8QA95_9CHLR|nr:histidinol-phosphate transaminase [Candidatus Roseilinea sp. NK_OTU-006]PJF46680.1 MAG: histidinol phosphate aminotransferase [Candidatus Thermofonsia Clade 3 bacterium]RMG62863.1 MAG: histidinol-phosphate aminotransferase family protein [Chloroflexota bacterium]
MSAFAFTHGGPQGPDDALLDFSVNTNPLGPNPALVRAWHDAPLADYPDPHYTRAREALAAWHGWHPDGVALGVGASELLHRLARLLVRPSDVVLSLGAPFGEFALAVAQQGGELRVLPRDEGGLRACLAQPAARVLYLSNPHNPTGHYLDLNRLRAFAGVVIADEAYLPFMAAPLAVSPWPGLVRVQSPSKAHGLLGMRLAYALAEPNLARELRTLQPAWAIPSPLAAALEALPKQGDFLARTLPTARVWAKQLAQDLGGEETGLHFFTVRVGDAAAVAAALRAQGIRIRDCASFGLPDRVRVAARTPADNRKLIEAWQTLQIPERATSRS